MEEKQPFKIRYVVAAFIALLIALIFYYGQTFEEALFTDGFPIPKNAKVVTISSAKKLESYTWKPASEEKGIPSRYKLIIRMSGWKEIDQFSNMTTYEKDGLIVDVITKKHTLVIQGQ